VDPLTTYYWTIQAQNSCGFGPASAVWSFTTAACVPVVVEITIDQYGNETTWELTQGTTVFASGGPYAQLASSGTQVQAPVNVCLPPGCYELKVYDSFGDGNCCAYGAGIIRVVDASQNVLASVSQDINIGAPAIVPFCVASEVRVGARAWLDGPFDPALVLMKDSLRVKGLLPLGEPYSALGFAQAAGGGGETTSSSVLTATGPNAIVDWVRLELRSAANSSTVVATRQALIQRDGDIVGTDGTSSVVLNAPPGSYYLAIRHRNHLGCMTLDPVALGSVAVTVDLASSGQATFGTEARRIVGGTARMWSGNVIPDNKLVYTNASNDRDPILQAIGGAVPTATIIGYRSEDVNLDGLARYTGGNNDRDPILFNIGGTIPTNIRLEQLP
jgi:hypothetical protein